LILLCVRESFLLPPLPVFREGAACYSRRTMPIVPPAYGRREMHPIVLLKETPIAALLGASPRLPIPPISGVEFGRFGDQLVIVNHRSSHGEIAGIEANDSALKAPR